MTAWIIAKARDAERIQCVELDVEVHWSWRGCPEMDTFVACYDLELRLVGPTARVEAALAMLEPFYEVTVLGVTP